MVYLLKMVIFQFPILFYQRVQTVLWDYDSINLVVTDNWQKGQGYTKPYHSSVMYIVVVHGAGIFANIYLKITQFRR